jgi:hypothetical protein
MRKSIVAKTTDPAAMMRDGWHEPERVFTAPPVSVLTGSLEERAFEILELIVGIYRISTHENVTRRGVCWADVQRWYAMNGVAWEGNRIYAAIAFLVEAGYLREGPPGVMTPPRLNSDYYVPTERGYAFVDQRQRGGVPRLWALVDGHKLVAVAIAAGVTALVSAGVAALLRLI